MKKIRLLVTLKASDDYIMSEPEWTLEEAITNSSDDVEITSVREYEEN